MITIDQVIDLMTYNLYSDKVYCVAKRTYIFNGIGYNYIIYYL